MGLHRKTHHRAEMQQIAMGAFQQSYASERHAQA
jgi:hypothetical protein